jgi:guanosine-3',5'-bis(diphosphate) 3'-pyrophosphohydrolase
LSDEAGLLEVILFAAERHKGQRRKDVDASPYINHPIAVAHLLATAGGVTDLTVLKAAILHDTVEDTGTSAEEIRARFGEAVARIVIEVSDDKSLPKARRKELQVEHARQTSPGAALVKLADKICNLRDLAVSPPAGWSVERRREFFVWARRVVDKLPPVNERLRAAFDEAYQALPG